MNAETHYPTAAVELGALRFYISGPMTGYPQFNFPAFDAARDFLVATGHHATSPADHDRSVYPDIEQWPGFETGTLDVSGPRFEDLIGWDLRFIASIECDAVLFLPGWERSRGAAYERTVAEACGRRVFYFDPEGPSMFEERPTTLIGLAGYAQSGKDTVGQILCGYGFERIAFADALKATLAELDPFISDGHWYPRLSTLLTESSWEEVKAMPGTHNPRVLLQRLGVAVREHVDPDAWVNAALRKVQPGGGYVITDVRFPNEFDEIRRRGGQVWRVKRPGTEPVNAHVSETAIDDREYDVIINNTGTMKQLARIVRSYI